MKSLKKLDKLLLLRITMIVVAASVAGLIVGYIVYASNKNTPTSSVATRIQPDAIAADGQDATIEQDTSAPSSASDVTFNYVDMNGWVEQEASDKSYSVRYMPNLTYATCPDIAGSLIIGVVAMTPSDYPCESLEKILSIQPSGPDSTILRTQTAIAQTDETWDRKNTTPIAVTLVGDQTANRYTYSTQINGNSYTTVEYETFHNAKRYIAINNWQDSLVPNTSIDTFDTIIQKTWSFK